MPVRLEPSALACPATPAPSAPDCLSVAGRAIIMASFLPPGSPSSSLEPEAGRLQVRTADHRRSLAQLYFCPQGRHGIAFRHVDFATAEEPYVLGEFFCAGCPVLIDAHVVRPDDPVEYDAPLALTA